MHNTVYNYFQNRGFFCCNVYTIVYTVWTSRDGWQNITKNMKLKYQPERTGGSANKEGTVFTYTLTDIEPYTATGDSRLTGFYAKVVERENAWRLFRADRIVELGA